MSLSRPFRFIILTIIIIIIIIIIVIIITLSLSNTLIVFVTYLFTYLDRFTMATQPELKSAYLHKKNRKIKCA